MDKGKLEIRTMTNEKGETWFVGKEVAEALGIATPPRPSSNAWMMKTRAPSQFGILPTKPEQSSSTRAASMHWCSHRSWRAAEELFKLPSLGEGLVVGFGGCFFRYT
ncbi:MAG: Bro-N domain-containing protein [Prevotella sp.]|nr:Bro-N domain-containing protein [Prevotella sp.]